MSDHHARRSDPTSSHIAVDAIVKNAGLAEQIQTAARRLYPVPFDDTDLVILVELQTERRQQRNVIARARGRLENDGVFERVGMRNRGDRNTVHFVVAGAGTQLSFDAVAGF